MEMEACVQNKNKMSKARRKTKPKMYTVNV